MRPLQKLTGKKVGWQWTKQQQETFDACKNASIEHAQLYTARRGYPFELEVIILDDAVSWGLWQMTGPKNQKEPVGFWSKALQGSAVHHTLTEKQILAVVWALQETERITGQGSVTVHTPLPPHEWVTDDSIRAHAGVARAATYWKWKRYLQQRFLLGKPHVTTPHATLLGTVSFNHMPTLGETLLLGDSPTSPVEEAPPYDELIEEHKKDAWFTDGSATSTATGQRQWRAVAYALVPGMILWQTGVQASSQWAELIAASLAILGGKARYLYTDSWVVYKSLTLWLPRWAPEDWHGQKYPIWGPDIWRQIWQDVQRHPLKVKHVSAHQKDVIEK